MKGGPAEGEGSWVPGSELLGGAAEGRWAERTGRYPSAAQPLQFISMPLQAPPQAPRPPHGPRPLGSSCVIYFLRRVCIIFHTAAAAAAGGLGVLFFWRAGVGGPFCHFASVEHLGSIKTVKPSQCTLKLENNPNRPMGLRVQEVGHVSAIQEL